MNKQPEITLTKDGALWKGFLNGHFCVLQIVKETPKSKKGNRK